MYQAIANAAFLILAGVCWRWLRPFGTDADQMRRSLTSLVYGFLLPALVLLVLWRAPLGVEALQVAFVAASCVLGGLGLAWAWFRPQKTSAPVMGTVLLAAGWGNFTYLGLPVLEGTLGEWARSVAIQYDLFAATPLLLTPTYLASSQDVFPLEFMVMAAEHLVLEGEDPLAGVEVQPRYLRLQLERELRGKLLNLRSRIISSQGRKDALLALVHQALPALKALFKAYLQLTSGGFPNQPEEIMQAMAQKGHQMQSLNQLYQVRLGRVKAGAGELLNLLQGTCEELQTLTREVDSLAVAQGA